MSYRLARSLITLRKQINGRYPHRNKASDGWIGNPRHLAQGSASDHNPWLVGRDGIGVVTALDITHDPDNNVDIDKLTDQLAASRDPRIKYLIANGLILVPEWGWEWHPYTGVNPHTSHMHISVRPKYADNQTKWELKKGESFMWGVQPPIFDANYYLKQNPDVKKNYNGRAHKHWVSHGMKEGRPSAPNFHVREYLGNYPDLRKAYGKDYPKAVEHFYNYGIREGRAGRTIKPDPRLAVLQKRTNDLEKELAVTSGEGLNPLGKALKGIIKQFGTK